MAHGVSTRNRMSHGVRPLRRQLGVNIKVLCGKVLINNHITRLIEHFTISK